MLNEDFLTRKLRGGIAKQIVSDLFTESGCEVYQLGYESNFSALKNKIRNNYDDTSLRIRTFPDLLILSKDKPLLIEVKYRSYAGRFDIKEKELYDYQRFWPEAFIIIVIPDDVGFYAQRICDINPEGRISILEGKNVVALSIKDNFFPIKKFLEFSHIELGLIRKFNDAIKKIILFEEKR